VLINYFEFLFSGDPFARRHRWGNNFIIFSYRAQLSSCWARSRWASVRLISALTILRSSKSSFSKSVYPFALPPHVRPVESLFAEADYMFSHLYVAVVELEELRAMMTWRYLRLSIDFVHNLVINRLYLIDRKSFSFHGHRSQQSRSWSTNFLAFPPMKTSPKL